MHITDVLPIEILHATHRVTQHERLLLCLEERRGGDFFACFFISQRPGQGLPALA